MDSKAYFEKVMQDFNQFREGRSLRKYCADEGVDYNWIIKYKKEYPGKRKEEEQAVAPLEFIQVCRWWPCCWKRCLSHDPVQ